MSAYIYRVTGKLITLDDGRKAHVAKYAYKPYWYRNDTANSRAHFTSGCVASERMTLKADLIASLDDEGIVGRVYENKLGLKVFEDDYNFGNPDRMPALGSIRLEGKRYRLFPGVSHTPFDRGDIVTVCDTVSSPLSHPAMTVRCESNSYAGNSPIYPGFRVDTGEQVKFWGTSVVGIVAINGRGAL